MGKIGLGADSVKTMWRTLTCGAGTPALIEAYALIRNYPGFSDDDAKRFLKSMAERGNFLRYTTQPVGPWPKFNPFGYGNWLLYQLQGLLAIAVTFPELVDASEWKDHAVKGIETHAAWSILPDGGFSEYSYSYAAQVAEQFQWCYIILLCHRIPFSSQFADDLKRFHELFLKTATTSNLRIPFGDTTRGDGLTPVFCRWAAITFLDGRFKFWAAPCSEEELHEAFKALHPSAPNEALKQYQALRPVPPSEISDLVPETGWVVMRSGWVQDATVVALTYRTSERVYHSGYETLGLNIWQGKTPLLTRLQGRAGYEDGYPKGFHRTPATANLVLLQNEKFLRDSGSLRNWYSGEHLDYLDVDHLGADWSSIKRRILFLKPSWILVVDDIEGKTSASAVWQANTDTHLPKLEGNTAIIQNGDAMGTLHFLDAQPTLEAHPLPNSAQSVYLLKASRPSGPLPQRFITLLTIGETQVVPHFVQNSDTEEIIFGNTKIILESRHTPDGRFLVWQDSQGKWFAAGDGNPSESFTKTLAPIPAVTNPEARVQGSSIPQQRSMRGAISADQVSAFEWIGADHITTVATGARIYWKTEEKGSQAVLYREAGSRRWRRQLQPGLHHEAWILIPDLKPNRPYELQIMTELPDGTVLMSEPFQRQSPKKSSNL